MPIANFFNVGSGPTHRRRLRPLLKLLRAKQLKVPRPRGMKPLKGATLKSMGALGLAQSQEPEASTLKTPLSEQESLAAPPAVQASQASPQDSEEETDPE